MPRHLPRFRTLPLLLIAAATLLCAGQALAKKSDRDQPMDVSAADTDVMLRDDGSAKLSGDVTINQGTLEIKADNALVQRKAGAVSHITLTGTPATMRQEKDEGGISTARATRIEYDVSSDKIELNGSVVIDEPGGSLNGEHLTYDLNTGRIEGGGEGKGRVNMRLLPGSGSKSDDGTTDSSKTEASN